jgi:predicted transport protein
MKLFTNSKTYNQFQFDKEADFERDVVLYSKQFFGINSIYIDAKRKIETKSFGNSIPDGFLFDLSDKDNPEFYIVEVELAKHDFYNHIFPQITKFFGFYKNPKSQNDLVEKIFSFINNDNDIKKEFKKYLGEKEIYKFIKDTIERSQNILLVIDGDKKELPEIMETYTDTWGKMVKLILIKKFYNNGESIYSMHPDFENIEFADLEDEISVDNENDVEYNEEYHFDGVSETVRQIYTDIKTELLQSYPDLIFNPQKYYISIRKDRNIAFFSTRRKKIRLVVMQSDEETRSEIKNHPVKTLAAGVQKFWNGPSCAIMIDNADNLDEIKKLLKKLIAKN